MLCLEHAGARAILLLLAVLTVASIAVLAITQTGVIGRLAAMPQCASARASTVVLLAIMVGALSGYSAMAASFVSPKISGQACELRAVVQAAPLSDDGLYTLRVLEGSTACGTRLAQKRLYLRVRSTPSLLPGYEISVRGTLVVPQGQRNPFETDTLLLYLSRGFSGSVYGSAEIVRGHCSPVMSAVLRLRRRIASILDESIPESEAAFLKGILLGEAREVDSSAQAHYRASGVYHVLAVSGLHVHFVLAPVERLLKRLGPWQKVMARASVLTAYCMLTAARPSVIRASIMALLPGVARVTGRAPHGISALSVACLAILIGSPLAIFDPALQLSMGATAGLVLLSGRIERALTRLPRPVASPLSATLSAQAMTVPVLAGQSEFSLRSLVANPVVVPLVGWALGLGMGGCVLGLVGLAVPARMLLYGAAMLVRLATAITVWIAGAPLGQVFLRSFGALETLAYYTIVLLVSGVWRPRFYALPRCRPAGNALLIALIALAAVLPGLRWGLADALQITFLDVGNADCIVIEVGGRAFLVDVATESAAIRSVAPFLVNARVSANRDVLVTHRHHDHAGGVMALRRFPGYLQLFTGVPSGGLARPGELVDLPEDAILVSRGDVLTLRGGENSVTLEVLWPDQHTAGFSENDSSVVLMLRYREFRALLTGDAGAVAEQAIIESGGSGLARCYLLKVGHHGSSTSTTSAFLAAAGPRIAVICTGRNNFGHPHPDVVDRLKRAGAIIMRTDRHGAVRVVTDGARVVVRGWLRNGLP